MIPESPADGSSTAEKRVFERLRDDTSDEFVAFHHVAWLIPGERRPDQGEADFVVAHPERGLLVLEVKGGTISYDAAKGRWATRGKAGDARIKDPFNQARQNSHSLKRLLERGKRIADNRFFASYAVALPDTRMKTASLKPDAPRQIVIDGDDLRSFEKRLLGVLAYWDGKDKRAPLEAAGVDQIERALAKSFEVPAPLSIQLAEEERELLRLTEEQYDILDMLERHPRAAIGGCAGSGKTFLAAEKARRLADRGFRVLVVCFNRFLAEHLRRGLGDIAGVDVFSYDGLCRSVVTEAGVALPPEVDVKGEYWGELRDLFAEHVGVAAGRYGALIADEAQDFHEDWWLPLQLLLEHPDDSPLYVFFDDNQRIFPVPKNLPVRDEPYQLTHNCRNTQAINELVNAFYKGGTIRALGPPGTPLDPHFYKTESELLEQLDLNIRRWIEEAGVSPEDIALLTPKGAHRSALWRVDSLGGATLTDDPWTAGVLRTSIYKFKGLERLVVGVVELESVRDEVFYVGFSRPNVFLSIFAPESAREKFQRALEASPPV
jgi:Nuclease-related domain